MFSPPPAWAEVKEIKGTNEGCATNVTPDSDDAADNNGGDGDFGYVELEENDLKAASINITNTASDATLLIYNINVYNRNTMTITGDITLVISDATDQTIDAAIEANDDGDGLITIVNGSIARRPFTDTIGTEDAAIGTITVGYALKEAAGNAVFAEDVFAGTVAIDASSGEKPNRHRPRRG